MKDDISSGQSDLTATENLYDLNNPPVIREYLSASDEDKQLFEMTFKAFKTNTQLKAKESWYVWKMDLLGLVRPDVKEILAGMREVSLSEMQGDKCLTRCLGSRKNYPYDRAGVHTPSQSSSATSCTASGT